MNSKLAKVLLLILAAALASKGFKKDKAPSLPKKEAPAEAPEILKPLEPITNLFQKAAGITWDLARKYFRG